MLTIVLVQVSALNAAARYLDAGDKVIVVDRGMRWGGQWVGQYDFVRLHQPYSIFTAGRNKVVISNDEILTF